jgi:hypothetical protein
MSSPVEIVAPHGNEALRARGSGGRTAARIRGSDENAHLHGAIVRVGHLQQRPPPVLVRIAVDEPLQLLAQRAIGIR